MLAAILIVIVSNIMLTGQAFKPYLLFYHTRLPVYIYLPDKLPIDLKGVCLINNFNQRLSKIIKKML